MAANSAFIPNPLFPAQYYSAAKECEAFLTDKALVKAMQKRISAALRNLRERTLAQSQQGAGGMLLWRVK